MDSLDIAFAEARRYLASLDTRPVASRGTPDDMRLMLPSHFPEHGMPANDVVRAIAAAAEPGLTANASGRFFAWVKGGALPAALATDIMCSAWDQNAVLASTSPAGAVLEEIAGQYLLEALGLPSDASYAFVTGCQMAHTTALAAARHGVLARQGWDGQQIGGDIFPFRAITACCPFDENAVFIQQIDRKPVYLWLPHKSQRFVFSQSQEAADAFAEIAEFFWREHIIQA